MIPLPIYRFTDFSNWGLYCRDADQTLEEEEEENAALHDVMSDESMEDMIESNEIPDSEGLVRMEGKV